MAAASASLRSQVLAAAASFLFLSTPAGTEQSVTRLYAKDALTLPNQTGAVEVLLIRQKPGGDTPVSGEPVELVQDGKVVVTATTGPSGTAVLRFTPPRKATVSLRVSTAERSSLSASGMVTVAAWERRTPLLVVEMAALVDPQSLEALPDAADELNKLTQFYYNVIYLAVDSNDVEGEFRTTDRVRAWLATHQFPKGYILALPSASKDWGTKIDELRAAGWTTVRVGIGRTKEFLNIFLERRLEAILVPAPENGSVPKKARKAKDWKDVRTKL